MSKPIVWSRVRLPSLALHRGTLVRAFVALLLSWANRIWGLLPELHLIVLTPFLLAMFVAIRVTKRRGVLRDGEAIVVVDERGREKGRFALATVATLEASLETKRNEPTVVQEANLAFVREDGALIADMTFGAVEERLPSPSFCLATDLPVFFRGRVTRWMGWMWRRVRPRLWGLSVEALWGGAAGY